MVERRNMPLFAWGEALRAARAKRRRLRRRAILLGTGVLALGLTIAAPPRPRLVWNASASAPIGLYLVTPDTEIRRGDTVVARLPKAVRGLAAERYYLPANVPLVKEVAAVSGDTVCALGDHVLIVGGPIVARRIEDAKGRILPRWNGCRTLVSGEAFLLMAQVPDSFDGRYFGVTEQQDIIGKAALLWAR